MLVFFIVFLAFAHGLNKDTMSTNYGSPVDEARDSQTLGRRGPHLLQDMYFLERLQTHNRERIPERNVHARGATAKGSFTPTNLEFTRKYTTAAFLNTEECTPIAVRFSTVIHSKGSPEYLRDPRGFSMKLYTQEGNYDVVGLNFPIFFIRDALRFPEMIRSLKPNPKTGIQEWWRIWDYFSHYPESVHMFSWLLSDIGIPMNYRTMDGWGIHTYKWISQDNNQTLVRYYWKSHQGVHGFPSDEAAAQIHFSNHTADLYEAIEELNGPKWTWCVQMIDPDNQEYIDSLDFDILDTTKEWPRDVIPCTDIGEFTLNKNVDSQYLENEQIAFSPGRYVPGIEASDEKMLQGRMFAYADTQRYRLGTNNQMLPINRPKCPFRDPSIGGQMNFQDPSDNTVGDASEVNYFPSEFNSVKEWTKQHHDNEVVQGQKVRQLIEKTNDFEQAGKRYLAMSPAEQDRFAMRVGVALSDPGLNCRSGIRETWLNYWEQANSDLADKIESYIKVHTDIYQGKRVENHETHKRFAEAFHKASGSQPRLKRCPTTHPHHP